MGRMRISIAGLMAVVAISAVVLASLRQNSGVGVNLVFCIALALNFAAVVLVPTGLDLRLRMTAMGYAIGGWGWMLIVAFVPPIDSFLLDSVVTPVYIKLVAPRATPNARISNPTIRLILLLSHSLCTIAAGLAGASVAWKLGTRDAEPDQSTIPTTGLP